MADSKLSTPDSRMAAKYCDKFAAAARARQPFEREWHTNLAFYFGKHYVQWIKNMQSGTTMSMVVPRAPDWRVRLIINRLKPIIRKEIAKFNKEDPEFYVQPDTPDDEDIAAARMAEAIAMELLLDGKFSQKKFETLFWVATCGTGFFKTHAIQKNNEYEVEHIAPTPFHLWVPNIEVQDIEDQEWVCHGLSLSQDKVFQLYGEEVDPDQTNSPETKFLHSLGISQNQESKTACFVKEFWVKPCKDFPKGALFVVGNKKDSNEIIYMSEAIPEPVIDEATGQPLKDEEGNIVNKTYPPSNVPAGGPVRSSYPYSHGEYPFAKVAHIPTGRFYGESLLVDLIPIQKEYNKNRSQTTEARNLTAKPQWAVAKGSVDVKKIIAKPGLVIEYTPGFDKPDPIKNPELPSYVFQDLQQTVADLDYISNQYEITQGRTPPGVEAASAISFLLEENDSILQPTIRSLEIAVEKVGRQSIKLARDYWTENRMIKIISGDQVYEVMQFKRGILQKDLPFRVVQGSMQPRSRAAKQAFLMEMIQLGVIPPIEGLKYLEMTEVNRLYAELQIDHRQVERENFRMSQGMPVPINIYDNHEIHLVSHGKFLKSQKFETLPDPIKQIHLQHYQEHLLTLGQQTIDGDQPGLEQQEEPVQNAGPN